MVVIRAVLGALILFFDWVFTPRGIKRTEQDQKEIDIKTAKLTLYHYKACPFCVKVRRAIKRNSLKIDMRDPKRNEKAKEELVQGAGKLKVPCLRIEEDNGDICWMFESKDIISYLEQSFNPVPVEKNAI